MFDIEEAKRLTLSELPIAMVTSKSDNTIFRKNTLRQIIKDTVVDISCPFTKEMKNKVLEKARHAGFHNTTPASLETTMAAMRRAAKESKQTPRQKYSISTQGADTTSFEECFRLIDLAARSLLEIRKILSAAAVKEKQRVDQILLLEKKLDEIRKIAVR